MLELGFVELFDVERDRGGRIFQNGFQVRRQIDKEIAVQQSVHGNRQVGRSVLHLIEGNLEHTAVQVALQRLFYSSQIVAG